MPAQDTTNAAENHFWHIYNKAKENNFIFKDEEDYQLFIGYLDEYLTPPPHPDEIREEFTINGRTYKGAPHQVKNYHNKIELLAYGLDPLGFHLLIDEKEKGAVKKFMRSITTRYSMNFNKKYQRSGSLFNGPYKSDKICDSEELKYLSAKIHKTSQKSSFPDYQNLSNRTWINTKTILSSTSKEEYSKYVNQYKVEQTEPSSTLERIPLERSNPSSELTSTSSTHSEPMAKFSEIAVLSLLFLSLFGLGLKNVRAANSAPSPTSTPKALVQKTEKDEISSIEVKTLGVKDEKTPQTGRIQISNDDSIWVNIHKNPQSNTEIITKTQNGDTYEYKSVNSGWYEVILPDGQSGYISDQFIKIIYNNE